MAPSAPRRIVAIVNAHAGSVVAAGGPEALEKAFRRHGLAVELRAVPGSRAAATAQEAAEAGADVVVAVGGDGTVSAVASRLVGSRAAFGVVPLGTLNHFARDCSLPLELEAAVENVVRGEEVACDAGSVNGLVFVNNATLGLYADQVRVRERWKGRLGKWPAAGLATIVVLRRFSSMRLSIEADGEEARVRTPLLVVSNNPYALEAGKPHGRERLDAGEFGLYVVRDAGRWRLVRTAIRSLLVSIEGDATFDARRARRIVVSSRRRSVRVALDGEVVKLRPPLRYEVLPGALRVLGARAAVPAASAPEAAS